MSYFCSFFLAFSLLAHGNAAPHQPAKPISQPVKKEGAFKPFTGKVVANKVRIRVKPDLESSIIRQVNQGDLLLVTGEEGSFFAIEPPKETKAYVFRSYVLDNVVEANRVNVRLEPHVDAPIIAQLQAGEKVQGQVCPLNHKWLEIAPPKSTCFYISKEYLSHVGGADYLATMEKRKAQAEELLNSSYLLAETECKKPYEEMNPQQASDPFQTILQSFADFPEIASHAKEGLALLKETYLNKKIAYLEAKAELTPTAKEELIAKHKAENRDLEGVEVTSHLWDKSRQKREVTASMQSWDAIEESLYLNWSTFHSGKKIADFYAEQKANATLLTGTVENYSHPIKEKPGDYILRGQQAPLAYLYSTQIDLDKYAGKEVTLLAVPRPNHHFAFPAYFVLSVE